MRSNRSPSQTVALAASVAWHAAIAGLLLWAASGEGAREVARQPPLVVSLPAIVFLDKAGLSGGGGSGGNQIDSPAAKARRPGHDRLTTPVARPPDPLATPSRDLTPPDRGLDIPAMPQASALDSLPGAIQPQPGLPTSPDARGPGLGDGVGRSRGSGEGDHPGDGLGNDDTRGMGPGPYRLGAGGLTPPVPLYRGAPRYTSEAAQHRVQGSVWVECIVQPTGRCTDFRIVRTIQPPYGLDHEAVVAAGEWRFKPGVFAGEQVPVLVTIEVAFNIR